MTESTVANKIDELTTNRQEAIQRRQKKKRVRNLITPDTMPKTVNHPKCRLVIGRIKRNGNPWLKEDYMQTFTPNEKG